VFSQGRRPGLRAGLATAAAVLTTACSVSNLNLVTDHRLHFLSPASRAHLHLPIVLRWTIQNFRSVPPASATPSQTEGYFAIFIDRSPVGPGESLASIAHNDTSCKRTPSCPDATYFTNRQIYTTTRTTYTLDHVDNLTGNRETQQLHEVTVILLDSTGHRIAESAWYLDFWLPQAGMA
jgi:hypothetical protein